MIEYITNIWKANNGLVIKEMEYFVNNVKNYTVYICTSET